MLNPFHLAVSTAELPAKDAFELFSNVFSEFHILLNPGNTFLNGARGSGKTMMFRLMKPDCYSLLKTVKLHQLDFLGIYIGIKDTHLKEDRPWFSKK